MTKFNSEQLLAIQHFKGACGVVAGAGSGKTSVLVNRIKNLIETHNVPQENILAVSFTSNTSSEMRKKLKDMGYENVNAGTFHSVCRKILTQEGISVDKKLTEWDIDGCFKKIDIKADSKDISSFISYQKSYRRKYTDSFVEKESKYSKSELKEFYKAYEKFKTSEKAHDYDDQLLLCLDVLEANRGKYTYEFILVDEHQDSNMIQQLLLKELCPSGNMFAVYDAKQSVYKFRGGNPEYAMNFAKDWENATIINLYKNYRSTKNIVENANKFIRPYFATYEHYVDSEANNVNDGIISLNTYYERETEGIEVADKIEKLIKNGEELNEIAVLYRNNSHSRYIENELKRRGIEYEIDNKNNFFNRKEVKWVISYLRFLSDPHNDYAFNDVLNTRNHPLKFLSAKVSGDIRSYSGMNDISMYEALIIKRYEKPFQQKAAREFEAIYNRLRLQMDRDISLSNLIKNIIKSFKIDLAIGENYLNKEDYEERMNDLEVLKSLAKGHSIPTFIEYIQGDNTKKKKKKDAVKLMSIHKSKGLEYNTVFLVGVEDGAFPNEMADEDEEARVFYVAISRSKNDLHISQIGLGESGKGNQFILEYFNNK